MFEREFKIKLNKASENTNRNRTEDYKISSGLFIRYLLNLLLTNQNLKHEETLISDLNPPFYCSMQ